MSNKHKAKTKAYQAAPARKNRTKMPLWVWIGLGVFLVVAVAASTMLNSAAAPAKALPAEISVAQAAEKRAAGTFILDVREPFEWEELHIPEATLIPLAQLSGRVDELPKDQEIVVVCRSGNRSLEARQILLNAGFTKVTSMAGGMNQWYTLGFPTVSGP
jgi:rhodanese-related sulfurtransferase